MTHKELFAGGLESIKIDQTDTTHENRLIVEQLCRINVDMAHEIVPRWAQEIIVSEGQRREVEHSLKTVAEVIATLEKALRYLQVSINHLDTDITTEYLAKVAESIFPEELSIPEDWEEILSSADKLGRVAAIVENAKDLAFRFSAISLQTISSIVRRMDEVQVPIIKKRLPLSVLKTLRVSHFKPSASTSLTGIETDDQRLSEITSILFILEFNVEEYTTLLTDLMTQKDELEVKLLELIHSLNSEQLGIFKKIVKEKYLEEGMFLPSRRFRRSSDSFVQ